MKLKRLEGESEDEWQMRQLDEQMRQMDEHLRQTDRNMKQVEWMWKWLLVPMWSFLIILWIWRLLR